MICDIQISTSMLW